MSGPGGVFLARRLGALRVAGEAVFLRTVVLRVRDVAFGFDLADRAEESLDFFMVNGFFHVAANSSSWLYVGVNEVLNQHATCQKFFVGVFFADESLGI